MNTLQNIIFTGREKNMEKRCSRKLFVIAVLCLLLNMAMTIHVAAETVSANEVKAERVLQETSGGETEILYSGMSGDLEWTIDENGLLTITGEMDPYCGRYSGWLEYRDSIITAKVSVVGTEDLMKKCFGDAKNWKRLISPDQIRVL